jgi:hypothetical protein
MRRIAVTAGMWCLISSAALLADDAVVGPLGDPARWGFTGDRTYDVVEVREALAGDVEVLLASRPQAPRARLLAVMAAALERGYRSKGFADPRVSIAVDPQGRRLACDIVAGRQYHCGGVEIRGATRIPVESLREALTKSAPAGVTTPVPIPGHKTTATGQAVEGNSIPYLGAFWMPGERASFTPFAKGFARQGTIDALRRIGWFDPTLDVSFRPEEDGTATLVIDIADDGHAAVLGDIEVQGLVRNSSEQVIEYLGLQRGQPLSAAVEAEIRQKLVAANRFVKSGVEVVPPPFGDGPCKLIVTVKEAKTPPLLGEELTPLQQRALRAAASMTALQNSDWEMTVVLPQIRPDDPTAILRFRVSAEDGIGVLELVAKTTDDRMIWNPQLLADHRRIVFLSGDGCRKLEVPLFEAFATCSLKLVADREGADDGGHVELQFGFEKKATRPNLPVVATISMESLAAILEVSQPGTTHEEVGDDTVIRHDKKVLRIDRHSDEFRELTGEGRGDSEGSIITLSCRPGRLRAAWPELMAAVERAEPALVAERPVTSSLRFLLTELRDMMATGGEPSTVDWELWDRILAAGALASLDQWALSDHSPKESRPDRFFLPPTWSERGGSRTPEWLNFGVKWAWSLYNQVVPRDTPLWVMGREAMFLVLRPPGVTPASPQELAILLRDAEAGPLQLAIAAAAFGRLHPVYRVTLAEVGRDALSPDAFRRDVELLIDERRPIGQLIHSLAAAFRDVSDTDVALLTARLGPDVQQAAVELRQRNNEPLETVLLDVATRLWPSAARPWLEAWLTELSSP